MTKSSVNKFRWISVSFCILLVACFVLFQTYRQSERDIKRFIHELEELRNKDPGIMIGDLPPTMLLKA